MPIFSSRQVWHFTTYSPSGERMQERVQSSHVRKFPPYEKGAKVAIDSLPNYLWYFGHYCWSAEVEGSEESEAYFLGMSANYLGKKVESLDKPEAWKIRAYRLVKAALEEVRYRNPPDMSASRKPLYTQAVLLEKARVKAKDFDREIGGQWAYLTGELESWVGRALEPVAKWIKEKEDL